jgi:hypothetical protein
MSHIDETQLPVLPQAGSGTLSRYLADAMMPSLLPYSVAAFDIQERIVRLAETLGAAMIELNQRLAPFIETFVTTDWVAVLNDHEKSFLYMADCGWTPPDWIGLSDLHALRLKSPEELDRYFVEGFMENDAENLKELGNTLKKIPRLSQWHPMIDEIIMSIEKGWYLVAVPATLTVMDGYLASALVNASLAAPSVTSPFKVLHEAKWHEDDTFNAVFWKSGITFLSRVFANSDFSQQPPTFINRHWVLHGRASVGWTLSDALRLVNSLTMLDFLFVTVGQPKPDDPRWHGDPSDGFSITRRTAA